jgi:hypothetical protein
MRLMWLLPLARQKPSEPKAQLELIKAVLSPGLCRDLGEVSGGWIHHGRRHLRPVLQVQSIRAELQFPALADLELPLEAFAMLVNSARNPSMRVGNTRAW